MVSGNRPLPRCCSHSLMLWPDQMWPFRRQHQGQIRTLAMELISSHFLNPSCACAGGLCSTERFLGLRKMQSNLTHSLQPQKENRNPTTPGGVGDAVRSPRSPRPETCTRELEVGAWNKRASEGQWEDSPLPWPALCSTATQLQSTSNGDGWENNGMPLDWKAAMKAWEGPEREAAHLLGSRSKH